MRVLAIESCKDGILKIYGEGEYLGDKVPSSGMLGELNITNPCIKLDSGEYIWGYMCWWGDLQKCKGKFSNELHTAITVPVPENIPPKPDSNEI